MMATAIGAGRVRHRSRPPFTIRRRQRSSGLGGRRLNPVNTASSPAPSYLMPFCAAVPVFPAILDPPGDLSFRRGVSGAQAAGLDHALVIPPNPHHQEPGGAPPGWGSTAVLSVDGVVVATRGEVRCGHLLQPGRAFNQARRRWPHRGGQASPPAHASPCRSPPPGRWHPPAPLGGVPCKSGMLLRGRPASPGARVLGWGC